MYMNPATLLSRALASVSDSSALRTARIECSSMSALSIFTNCVSLNWRSMPIGSAEVGANELSPTLQIETSVKLVKVE